MGTSKYSFKIKDAGEFDFARILRENDGAEALLIVTDVNAALVLRQDFLERFDRSDCRAIGGEVLSHCWGYRKLAAQNQSGSVRLAMNGGDDSGYRCMTTVKDDIEERIAELRAAREFLQTNKRKVTVSQV